ncbi:uncharacterized protein LOC126969856 [Leptidea sinapis]|uniref:uncharacterized protein LOC126969856 n=1 Tax=Leptidea sinapis TaxID=189913 RepID=UPI0021C28B48|nr:uncharacterized protein LOC126969856 [Leptidea sinapis]
MDKKGTIQSNTKKGKRYSVMPAPSSSTARNMKEPLRPKPRSKTVMEFDSTSKSETTDFHATYQQVAFDQFLRTMLEDCLIDDKIKREENEIDIQMAQLSGRFMETIHQMEKTNRRLKDISFVVEQQRLLDLKNQDCSKFHDLTEQSDVQSVMKNLATTNEDYHEEQACLDRLETKNVVFGYNKESGHKQLLDAVNDAIDGSEQIKKHSNLDMDKFKEFEKTRKSLDDLGKDRFDLSTLKDEFDEKFPDYSQKLIKEVSDKIEEMMNDDL